MVRCVQKSGNKTKSLYVTIDFESEIYPDQAARALDRWHEKKGEYQVLLQNEQNGSITAKHLNAFLRLEVHTRYAPEERTFHLVLTDDERLELSNLAND
ncbi:hypothetical protein [Listeria booriae]|uniref:Uncharacterized protein n=1 Tax=Listeria booriae TaxID=1552123 RepID=A0A7X0ZX23_9LIST|nr:hypothetical protein [Listeria booriae]MBC1780510.1 hypothetical protein [Listeria booriae]MBC2305862.1 hypothetical protein [Listeria booriae]MBC2312033.1 hypothetical protein [Listeria booriae]MBC6301583.1 hypothetical protein [Listeria booriae]